MRKLLERLFEHFRSIFDTEASGRLILYAPLVGLVAGLGAAAFFSLLQLTQEYCLGYVEGYFPPPAGDETAIHLPQLPTNWWAVLLVPTMGGLICGLLVYGFAPEAEGHGTDAMVRAFHRLGGAFADVFRSSSRWPPSSPLEQEDRRVAKVPSPKLVPDSVPFWPRNWG